MHGRELRDISYRLEDFSETTSIKESSLFRLSATKETLFRVTDAAISFFEKHANGGERFRLTLQRVGEEEFKKRFRRHTRVNNSHV